jgi:hypothetical protein
VTPAILVGLPLLLVRLWRGPLPEWAFPVRGDWLRMLLTVALVLSAAIYFGGSLQLR